MRPRNKSGTYTFFSLAAVAGIALGVATLVVALSVLEGYEKVISEKLTNFDADIQVFAYGNQDVTDAASTVALLKGVAGAEIKRIDISAQKICILGKRRINEGVTLKGVDSLYLGSRQGLAILDGSFGLEPGPDSVMKVVIGKTLATKLRVKAGDMINFFAINAVDLNDMTALPAVENFQVAGIYQSGMGKYDDAFAYTSLGTIRKLYEMGDNINLIEIKLKDPAKVNSLRDEILPQLKHPLSAVTYVEANMQMFNWIELQRKPVPIVLGLIILVAAFNIISALLMLVLDKTNTIGTLKALGAAPGMITGIFLVRGMLLGVAGSLAGVVLGFILAWLQSEYSIVTLNPQVYFVDKVPISINPVYFVAVFAISVALSFLSSLIPAFAASRVDAVKALRFN
ncbi:MAG: ABC transporter permease [Chlorobiota bacterium]|nr:MAG: ABC transporter permease [Chlorobiota bacterium]